MAGDFMNTVIHILRTAICIIGLALGIALFVLGSFKLYEYRLLLYILSILVIAYTAPEIGKWYEERCELDGGTTC